MSTPELRDQIKDTIESEDVVLFMKGTPERVLCGNSSRALEALRSAGASVVAVDVLPDPAIRQELSALSQWPTIPQVFVKGELVGGADIVEELAENGELTTILDQRLGDGWNAGTREERVAEVGSPSRFPLA
jgi:monothiol glutaredoxin